MFPPIIAARSSNARIEGVAMRLKLSILSIMSLAFALTAHGGEPVSRGDVYPATGGDTPLFTIEKRTKETDTGRIYFERYTDRSGEVVAELEAVYVAGRLSTIRFDQHQLGEVSTAAIKDGKATYSNTSGGKTRQSTERDPGDLAAFPAIPDVIRAKWDDLQRGKSIEFTIPIPARRMSFRAKVTKEKTWSQAGRMFSQFKMEPTNPIMRTLGDAIYYEFDHQGKTLTEFRGGTIAQSGTPGNWKNFVGRIVYRPAADAGK
jgi:hypothetical protein